jgi:fructoselysine-6-P-deglycase FrlB-like protein
MLWDKQANGRETLLRLREAIPAASRNLPLLDKRVQRFGGGPHSSLPWLAEDDAATDPITMLVPAYRMIEQTARACGLDPDRPPRLSKITETF